MKISVSGEKDEGQKLEHRELGEFEIFFTS
jgi:hypothetical protein